MVHDEKELDDEYYSDDEFGDSPAPVNVAAVVALIISLGGFMFVTHEFFFFIPALGIIVSIVAIGVFTFSRRPMVGKWLCAIALGLSLFFVVWRISYERMRAVEVTSDSVPVTMEWLEYLKRGETIEAHVLTKDFSHRASTHRELLHKYRDPHDEPGIEPEQLELALGSSDWAEHKGFLERPVVKDILDHRDTVEFRFLRSGGHFRTDHLNDEVGNLFEMTYEENGEKKKRKLFVVMNREDRGTYFNAHWYMKRMSYATDLPSGDRFAQSVIKD